MKYALKKLSLWTEDSGQVGGSWVHLLLAPNSDNGLIFWKINWTVNRIIAGLKFGSQGVQKILHKGGKEVLWVDREVP